MKIEYVEDIIIIYIYSDYENRIKFTDKEKVEKYFRELFLKLKKYYAIILSGFYQIKVYVDPYYGAIITLEKEDFDYYTSFDETLDMRIVIDDTKKILFQCEDVLNFLEIDGNIYQYQSTYYIELKKMLPSVQMGKILEYSSPVYGEIVEDVIQYGKKIK